MKADSTRRFYAKRLSHPHTRRHQIGLRVCGVTKNILLRLSRARMMSVSEYLARLVNDHLVSISERTK